MPEQAGNSSIESKVRVGVKLRVLASMGVAMTIFFVALLYIVYSRVNANHVSNARSIVISLIPLVVIVLVVCGLLFFFLTNRFVLRPIRKIRDAALAISKGELDTVIATAQNDEIGDLARSVDEMARALKQNITSLKAVDKLKSEFIAISSHNLRTPLAGIEGGLDLLQTAQLDEQTKKMLHLIRESANNLIAFSEDMLIIANIESGRETTIQQEEVSLKDLFTPLITDLAAETQNRNLSLTTELSAQEMHIQANTPLLRLAFRNILENACKFTPAGGNIKISLKQVEEGYVDIKISDSGIGIANEELPNLFTKFHRGTDTLTYNYEGLGVGLYIAKLILDQHHASIEIHSTQGKGTEVTVRLTCVTVHHS